MRKAEKEYKKLLEKRKNIKKQLDFLMKDPIMQTYISLCREDSELENLQEELYNLNSRPFYSIQKNFLSNLKGLRSIIDILYYLIYTVITV